MQWQLAAHCFHDMLYVEGEGTIIVGVRGATERLAGITLRGRSDTGGVSCVVAVSGLDEVALCHSGGGGVLQNGKWKLEIVCELKGVRGCGVSACMHVIIMASYTK